MRIVLQKAAEMARLIQEQGRFAMRVYNQKLLPV
jgi:hypothetical protein